MGNNSPLRLFWDGFLTNFPNPGVWIFWGAVISFSLGELFADNPLRAYLFFAGLLGTSLSVDTAKGFLASRLRKIMSHKRISIINKIAGSIYICFSAYLVISMLVFNLDPKAQERQLEQEKNPQAVQAFKQIDKGLKDVQKRSTDYIVNR